MAQDYKAPPLRKLFGSLAMLVLVVVYALAIMVVLMTFGGALGLSIVSPQPYAGLSARASLCHERRPRTPACR